MTRFEKIKSMTLEEMAKEIFNTEYDFYCRSQCSRDFLDIIENEGMQPYCIECIKSWLNS